MSACHDGNSTSTACNNARNAMRSDVGNNIDPYAIDWPVCHTNSKYSERYLFYKHQQETGNDNIPPPGKYAKMIEYFKQNPEEEWWDDGEGGLRATAVIITTDGFPYDPCEENYMDSYLNQAAVQAAIHCVPKHWPGTTLHYQGGLPDMTVVWQWIIDNTPTPLHLTIVSGDDDTVCGLAGTQSWMWGMGWTVDTNHNWNAWTDTNRQTGGYLTKWRNAMNLVTVHSAGHLIPECQPSRSLQSFTRYLAGEF
eukprot:UN01911